MERLLLALRAAAEPTRLRIVALLDRSELTVSDLTRILGQSQPRVSRHLKLLCEARVLERVPEGSHVFFRIADEGPGADLAAALLGLVPDDDPTLDRDREQLERIRRERRESAARYFESVAERWDRLRATYVAEADVEAAMLEAAGSAPVEQLLDLGTGTGRILGVFAARVTRGLGIDSSREMLALARTSLEQHGHAHCRVRRGDIYRLDLPAGSADLVTIHHVLHFLDDPGAAIAEAARALRPRGRLLVVDFAPHGIEALRTELAHRRLGFADEQVRGWCESAGLRDVRVRHLEATDDTGEGTPLTVSIWRAVQHDDAPSHHQLEVA